MLIVSYKRIYFRLDVDLGFIENVERLERVQQSMPSPKFVLQV